MAGSPVRELITRVTMELNKPSVRRAEKEIRKLADMMKGVSNKTARLKVDTSGIQKANSSLSALMSRMRNMQGTMHIRQVISRTGGARANMAAAGAGVGSAVGGMAAAYGGYVGATNITDTADAMMNLSGRIGLVTKNEQERLAVEEQLYSLSQRARQPMGELGQLYFGIARAAKTMGFSQEENLRATETVGKALSIGGATTQEAAGTILQLSQALGSGRLQGDELRSLDENASLLMEHVAEYFGTNVAGLKEMGAQGLLTSDEVMKALLHASTAIDQKFMEMPMTFGQSMNVMGNSWDKFILGIERKSSVFSTVARGATKAFESVGKDLDSFTILMGKPKNAEEQAKYDKAAAENPGMLKVVKVLQDIGEWFDKLDGKAGNLDEQIAKIIKRIMKVGLVLAPILGGLLAFSGLSVLLAPIGTLFASIGTALAGIGIGLAPLAGMFLGVGLAVFYVYKNWDTFKKMFEPGLKRMQEGLEALRKAWADIQPFIKILIPIVLTLSNIIGKGLVYAINNAWNIFTMAFNSMAGLAEHLSGILGGVGGVLQWISDKLGIVIAQTGEFVSLNDSLASQALRMPYDTIQKAEMNAIMGSFGAPGYEQTNNIQVNSIQEATDYLNGLHFYPGNG